MAAPIISISSEESMGSYAPRVIIFGAIPAIIPEVSSVLADLIVAPEEGTVLVVSPTRVLDLVDYSSSSDSDPLEDSLPLVPDLPLVSPSGSSSHDTLVPSSGYPLAPVVSPPEIRRRRAILIRPGKDIHIGRLYRTHPGGPCRALTTRKSIRPLSSHRLALSMVIAPTPADLLPPRKRFRDSYSSEDSGEEHIELDTVDVEVVADIEFNMIGLHGVLETISKIVGERDRIDSIRWHTALLQEEFRQVRRDCDDTRRRLRWLESKITITRSGMTPEAIEELINRRVEEALAAYEATRAANALQAENQSQNGSADDNGNGSNRNGGNGNAGNKNGVGEARGKAYVLGGGDANPDSNVVKSNGEKREFLWTNTILRGYTLGLLGHPFNIDLMLVELGSFDVIIGMDWLANHHAMIVCDEKIEIENESEEKRLKDVPTIRDFPEVFPKDLPGLPPTRQVEFQIDLVSGVAPVARDLYRLALSKLQELSTQLHELSEKGFIRPSSSPWGAPVLFIKKKDGSFRICINYRELNKLTVKNQYPLLRIDELFHQLQGSRVYSKIDLRPGYLQLRVQEEDIKDSSEEEHEEHLKLILELLKKEEFEGIHVDPAKIESIKDWASPKTPTKIRQFLGRSCISTVEAEVKLCTVFAYPKVVKTSWFIVMLSRKGLGAFFDAMERGHSLRILEAQVEARKEENYGTEDLCGMIKKFKQRADGTLCLNGRCWIPCRGRKYQKPFGLLGQPVIPVWKWENITMDFITKSPKMTSGQDTI
ncbi:putative reverse transcriptase domain-containing protein [Tanacetum coccineum]